MFEYSRKVYYYETDTMSVVHHSNFVRWLEEARTEYFDSAGFSYARTEALGVMSPVTEMKLEFMSFARFGDTFTVRLKMIKYTGGRFVIEFSIINQNDTVLLEGQSTHAFVGKDYRPVSLSKVIPELHEILKRRLGE